MTLHRIEPPKLLSILRRVSLLATAACVLTGCPLGAPLDNAEEQNASRYEPPRDDCIDELLPNRCGGPGCHGVSKDGTVTGGVDLELPDPDSRVLDVPATYPNLTGCPDPSEMLVDSANPAESLMLKKVYGTQACGDGMPTPYILERLRLKGDDLLCLENWVYGLAAQGANP